MQYGSARIACNFAIPVMESGIELHLIINGLCYCKWHCNNPHTARTTMFVYAEVQEAA